MNLIIIQSAYPYRLLAERDLYDFALSKSLNGYFKRVFTVHPASTIELPVENKQRYGPIEVINHDDINQFIEAKVGFSYHLRSFPRLNFVIAQMNLFYFLFKTIRNARPLLIRAEDPRYNGLLAFLFSKIFRLPFIVCSWGNPEAIRSYTSKPLQPKVFRSVQLEEKCEKFLLGHADFVLVQNEDNASYAKNFGAKPNRVHFFRLGNSIHTAHFSEPDLRDSSPYVKDSHRMAFRFCTVSRLEKLKKVDHVIEAFSQMNANRSCYLFIAGDGQEMRHLKALARDMKLEDRIIFLGNLKQEELSMLLADMDVALCSSMGRALTEVSLAGIPSIAYDIDCHPELVLHERTGFLVKPLDVAGMARAADYLFENRQLSKEMGKRARTYTLEFMNPAQLIKEQVWFYEQLLKNQ